MDKKKKILVPIFNRAHYGRLRSVLRAINENPNLELSIIISSSVAYDSFFSNLKHSKPHSLKKALPWYIRARILKLLSYFNENILIKNDFLMKNIKQDGFQIDAVVPMFFDGGSSTSMAKAVGYGIMKLVDKLKKINPDMIFVNADRFEMMAVALSASYLNIPIIHNEGGDISGTLDESIRHSITKLSHIHFVSTESSRKRVLQMGENPGNVFVTGSPCIDIIKDLNLELKNEQFNTQKPFLLVLFHPVATETKEYNTKMAKNITEAIEELNIPTIFIGHNIDAGSKEVGLIIKNFLNKKLENVHFVKNLHPDDFYRFLAKAKCAIGNSSSFIREGAYFGTPVVLIGNRQEGREKDNNIMQADLEKNNIKNAIIIQMNHGPYEKSLLFGDGSSGEKIAKILENIEVDIQKKFFDI